MATKEIAKPVLATDVVLFAHPEKDASQDAYVLLVQRKYPPFQGCWVLPGGHVEENEPLATAAVRELEEETGVHLDQSEITQFQTFGDPGRDPRGWTVSVAYVGMIKELFPVQGADDAEKAQWFPMKELPPLGFDHAKIISFAAEKLVGVNYAENNYVAENNAENNYDVINANGAK